MTKEGFDIRVLLLIESKAFVHNCREISSISEDKVVYRTKYIKSLKIADVASWKTLMPDKKLLRSKRGVIIETEIAKTVPGKICLHLANTTYMYDSDDSNNDDESDDNRDNGTTYYSTIVNKCLGFNKKKYPYIKTTDTGPILSPPDPSFTPAHVYT